MVIRDERANASTVGNGHLGVRTGSAAPRRRCRDRDTPVRSRPAYGDAVTTVRPAAAPPASPDTTAGRLPSLTGLRFVAAFLVFGFHVHIEHLMAPGAVRTTMEWLFGQGAVGVSFFFILSGFVLTWSARKGDTAVRFWRRRIAKIYPNHVATWLVALAVAVVTGAGVSLAVALPNLVLAQAWSPDIDVFFGLNTVSWSLACEAFFYAVFPLLFAGLIRLPGRMLWPAATIALLAVWAVPLLAQILPAEHRYWAIWIFPLARTPEFLAGMLLARIVREGRWPRLGVWPATALAVVAYLTSRFLPDDFRLVAGTAIPLALLVAAVGAADAAGLATPWRSRWMIWLGEISFAFYLVHQLALRVVLKGSGVEHSSLAAIGVALGALVFAVAGSWLLYRCVELPGMRLLRPKSAGRMAYPATPVRPEQV
ncbi:acyltransferase family protein [Phytohabitans sp. LJ34]|uniref:acyltransferase family protein n=1 Tax=Phytohabitans sp. LJ34 TaxID=3452217 RepID=UPI003F8BA170